MLIGYARVSTADQNLDMQRDALTRAGCEKIFEEKKSGKAGSKRPEFEAALAYLGVGSGWGRNDTLSRRFLGPEIFAGQ